MTKGSDAPGSPAGHDLPRPAPSGKDESRRVGGQVRAFVRRGHDLSKRCFDDPDPFLERLGRPVVIHPEAAYVIRARLTAEPVEPALTRNVRQRHVEFFNHEFSPRGEIRNFRES